jgi:serine/threonine-protein kinase
LSEEIAFGSRYVLGPIVGRGAMGRVHRATVRATGEEVAIKVLRDDLVDQADVVARFVQERQVLASIDHPNVVRVRDLVVEGDQLGIVMDYVPGGDLRRITRHALAPAEAAGLLAQVADGLAAVHTVNVVHRDLKPENVMVHTSDGGVRTLRITDFGVSRLVGNTLTKITMVIGTPGYLAPEVAGGARPTPAADIYALGVMLYELSCGAPPFQADNALALLRAHGNDPVPRPGGAPDALWAVLSSMLAKDPTTRPTAKEAANAMRSLATALVGAPPCTPPARAGTIGLDATVAHDAVVTPASSRWWPPPSPIPSPRPSRLPCGLQLPPRSRGP